MFEVRPADLDDRRIGDLLRLHLAAMNAHSPPESVFALDLSALSAPAVTVWAAWQGERVASIGALKMIDGATAAAQSAPGERLAEIKSMRTHPDFLRRGAAVAILATIIACARDRRVSRLALETGSGPAFEPALALYRQHGFVATGAFGNYTASAFNQFLHLIL